MNESPTSTQPAPSTHAAAGSVSATRTGTRTYLGRNERGSTVLIGPAEVAGHFTPGELLKLALAGCAGMSSDRVVARRLGDDFSSTIWAHGTANPATESYEFIEEEMILELAGLSDAEKQKLITIIGKSIDASCTIARSVRDDIELRTSVNGVQLH